MYYQSLIKTIFIVTIALFSFLQSSISQVVINEYSCSNINTLLDNFGNYEDWIELYNTSASPVNLTGYYLSDKKSNPTKWQIPSGTIAANGHFIIFASGKNQVVGGNYHANFKLTQMKPEPIVLSNPSGSIIDSLTLKPTRSDYSRGRTTSGAITWSLFTTPTPNTSNANAKQEYATKPVMSPAGGFYAGATNVVISSADSNVVIRYTTDGSPPNGASTLYSTPVNVSATTLIRARAFSSLANIPSSFIETNTYFINVTHTMAVISVGSDDYDDLFDSFTPEIISTLEFFDINKQLKSKVEGNVNPHGNDSWAFPQKGIDFIVKDDYGYDYSIRHKIFNSKTRNKFQRIILKAGASDNYPGFSAVPSCHLRDAFVQSLSQKYGLAVDERSYEPCIVYINGQYWGVYEIRERVDDPDFTSYYYNQGEEDIDVLKYWGGLIVQYGSDTGWVALYNYIMANSMAIQANYNYVESVLNINSVIDNIIFNTYVVNSDWINWNTMWWRGRNPLGDKKKWRYALWDMDNVYNLGENYTGWPTTGYTADPCDVDPIFQNAGPDMGHIDIFTQLMDNNDFKSLYINRYADLMNTALSCDSLIAHLDNIINSLTPEMPKHMIKWGGSMGDWQNNINFIKSEINGRCITIDTGIVDCYTVSGPFNITVNIVPSDTAGDVKVNTVIPSSYAWTGSYFGNVNMKLFALPKPNYVFDHWELTNHNVIPDSTEDSVSFNITQGDVITAHFRSDSVPLPFSIFINVAPSGTGNVKIDTLIPPSYPWNGSYLMGSNIDLIAIPDPNYIFDYWELSNLSILPDSTEDSASVSITQGDVITAHFRSDSVPLPFSIFINVAPSGTGNVKIDTLIPPSYPWNGSYLMGSNIDLIAIPDSNYEFDYWELSNLSILPDSTQDSASVNITGGDNITAHFRLKDSIPTPQFTIAVNVLPALTGDVIIDTIIPPSYPWSSPYLMGKNIKLIALPFIDYEFDYWELSNLSIVPNSTEDTASVTVTGGDNIIAHFRKIDSITPALFIINVNINPSGAGSVKIDGIIPSSYPWSGSYQSGKNINLISLPNVNYEFDYWQLSNHNVIPASNAENVTLTVLKNDNIIAHFTKTETPPVIVGSGIHIPTAISPNNDGNNDVLYVLGETPVNLNFTIYNRWGQIVFETNNNSKGWDGTFKGEPLNSGVFGYKLFAKLSNGETIMKNGNITLIR